MPRLEVNGIHLAYEIYGSGKPIVLAHGYLGTMRLFKEQIAEFSKTYKVIVYDQRGHGASDKPEGEYSPYIFAKDLFCLMERLKIAPAVLLGHSMGSLMAQVFALAYPQKVRALILYGALSKYQDPGKGRGPWGQDAVREIEERGVRHHLRSLAPFWFASQTDRTLVESWLEEGVSEIPGSVVAAIWEGNRQADVSDQIQKIAVPTLIIVGEEDCRTPVGNSEEIKRKIPNSHLKVVKGAGHMIHLEKPREFNQAILDFLKIVFPKDGPSFIGIWPPRFQKSRP